MASDAQLVVTANAADFLSPRFVASGRIRVADPAAFLAAVLDEHQALMAAALEHLASNRRGVSTVADVLDQFDRNQVLRPFVGLARARLLL